MVEARYDHLVARLQVASQRAGDRERQGRHVRPEDDLLGLMRAKEVGGCGVRLGDQCIGLVRGIEGAVGVRTASGEMRGDGLDALGRHLGPPGSVEIGDGHPVMLPLQGGEMRAHRVGIQATASHRSRHGTMVRGARRSARPV